VRKCCTSCAGSQEHVDCHVTAGFRVEEGVDADVVAAEAALLFEQKQARLMVGGGGAGGGRGQAHTRDIFGMVERLYAAAGVRASAGSCSATKLRCTPLRE